MLLQQANQLEKLPVTWQIVTDKWIFPPLEAVAMRSLSPHQVAKPDILLTNPSSWVCVSKLAGSPSTGQVALVSHLVIWQQLPQAQRGFENSPADEIHLHRDQGQNPSHTCLGIRTIPFLFGSSVCSIPPKFWFGRISKNLL